MNGLCRAGRERRLYKVGCLLFLVVLFCWPRTTLAATLDGLTVGTLTIQDHDTLDAGELNVSGDLFIESGGLLDADRVDNADFQYSGTINVGARLEMVDGGKLTLNADALNILGYGTIDGTFNVLSGSTISANESSILGASRITVADSSSRFNLTNSTTGFHDELWVADGAVLNDTGSTIRHDSTIGLSTHERGDIIIVNGAAVNLNGSTVDITSGAGGWLKVDNSTLTATDSNLSTNWIESFSGSTHTYDSSSVVSRDSIWYGNSTVSQTGGETVFADELVLNQGTTMSVQGTADDHAVIRHQAVAGEVDNRGSLWLDNATLSLTNADFNVTSGAAGEIQVRNGSNLTATGSDMASNATIIDESSKMGLLGISLQTGHVDVNNGSALALDNSTVDTGLSEWMLIQGNSTMTAANNSQVKVGGVLHVQNESTVTLTNSDVDAENLWVEHVGSKVEMAGGSLNARTDIRIGNSGSPTGSLVLNGTPVTTGDLSVMGHLVANDSDIDAGDRFGGYGQDGTLAGVTLTGSSLAAKWIDFSKSQHNYQNSNITARDSTWFWNSTVTQTGGVTEFADQMLLLEGTAMTVQGTESNHAVVRHQADASEDDNRGELIVDHSTLDLTYADVNLSSGASGLLHVHKGGQLTAADSDLNGKKVVVETGGQIDMTGGSLTTNSLAVRSTSTFSATDAIINILGNTTTIDVGGSMVLNGGIYTEAGDLLVNGSLSGAAPVIHVGSDFLVADTATLAFTGPTEIFIGDDFINMLNSDLSQVIVHMLGTQDDDLSGDANEGSVFESLANIGRLIVETSLTLLDDLLVDQLVIDTGWGINLNGHSLVITESFIGSYDQIFGGSVTGPAPVPEPSTLVLVGGGLLGLVCLRRRK